MVGQRTRIVGAAVFALALAGCIDARPLTDAGDADAGATAWAALAQAEGCLEGGPVSMYDQATNPNYMPEPWVVDDINDDAGNPPMASYGQPNRGPTTGIWHFIMICDRAMVDGEEVSPFWLSYIGVKVLPPPWDTSGIERQFFVANLGFSEGSLVDWVKDHMGANVHPVVDAHFTWVEPELDLMHIMLNDEGHGEFESHAFMRAHAFPFESGPMRFWHLVGDDVDGERVYRPVAIDVQTDVHDLAYWVSNQGQRSLIHWNAQNSLPDHYGYGGGAILIEGFSRTITPGPQPEGVYVSQSWTH